PLRRRGPWGGDGPRRRGPVVFEDDGSLARACETEGFLGRAGNLAILRPLSPSFLPGHRVATVSWMPERGAEVGPVTFRWRRSRGGRGRPGRAPRSGGEPSSCAIELEP